MELGTLGEWAGAVASAVGVLISIVAFKRSKSAEDAAERANMQTAALEKQRDEREEEWREELRRKEEESELKRVAGSVHAYWATRKNGDSSVWGVVVANTDTYAVAFHNVKINARSRVEKDSIELELLPPGKFFIESLAGKSQSVENKDWGFAASVESGQQYEPVLNAKLFSIERIEFQDRLNVSWCWTPEQGVHRLSV
ncbi:hypothetical protein QP027_02275 [Corynebacterium breve]|uniref:DUF4352 domain-containing protein n=1 Tax=Corynebacterium breve TaxID=3049799 RepID=A0ABY8VFI7_9CORY|nr:hypothetical protein [Corynebacterium breve]WIM68249.1 hypothetical protein QP027_02275 [Corynebacterium breve]